MWNSVKQAAKNGKRSMWKAVVRFSNVANLNFGPFRSGCWGKRKQGFGELHGQAQHVFSIFRDAAQKQAAMKGEVITGDAQYRVWGGII